MDGLTSIQPKLFINSLSEYRQIFGLKEADLAKRILDVYAGFSSFNIEGSELGYNIISVDSFYNKNLTEDSTVVAQWRQKLEKFLADNGAEFDWHVFGDKEKYLQTRRSIANTFLADFQNRYADRYQTIGNFPKKMPFNDNQFQLALCAYSFFTEHKFTDKEAYQWITDLSRIATEIRIYPVLDKEGQTPALLGPLMLQLQMNNYGVAIEQISYQFQKGGNAMLKIWSQECQV